MGHQIIKQPNGKFCIFSSIVDSIVYYNMEQQDIIDQLVNDYRQEIENTVKKTISDLNNGGKPYYQFTMSYEQMLNTIKEIHGSKEVNKIKKVIEK